VYPRRSLNHWDIVILSLSPFSVSSPSYFSTRQARCCSPLATIGITFNVFTGDFFLRAFSKLALSQALLKSSFAPSHLPLGSEKFKAGQTSPYASVAANFALIRDALRLMCRQNRCGHSRPCNEDKGQNSRTIVTKVVSRFAVLQVSPSTRRNRRDVHYAPFYPSPHSALRTRDSPEFLCNSRHSCLRCDTLERFADV